MDRFLPPTAEPRATLVEGVRVIDPAASIDATHDLLIDVSGVQLDPSHVPNDARRWRGQRLWALPGLLDIQVHFRQPGFEHKETLETGSRAALAGGVTTAVVMPNTRPALDTAEAVRFQAEESDRVAGIRLLVAAAATRGLGGKELTDHGALAAAGAVAITDDGLPVMNDDLMAASLAACAEHDLLFMQHAEDLTLSRHRPINEGPTSRALGYDGQPAAAEGAMVERDVRLAAATGARYHVLHTSTARSLAAVRAAKAAGQRVSCEASPHHLLLTDEACAGGDPNTKMNPPLRCDDDRRALVQALADGTVDAVATDHAPHAAEEKAKGFVDGPFGVIGLETAFAALLSFVHAGVIDARRAVALMTSGPAALLGRSGRVGTLLGQDAPADVCLVDPRRQWTVTEQAFCGRSRNSAFYGWAFDGRVLATFLGGQLRYLDDSSLAR